MWVEVMSGRRRGCAKPVRRVPRAGTIDAGRTTKIAQIAFHTSDIRFDINFFLRDEVDFD
jgi:hypothetical protein